MKPMSETSYWFVLAGMVRLRDIIALVKDLNGQA
jgi:hypothetical protein